EVRARARPRGPSDRARRRAGGRTRRGREARRRGPGGREARPANGAGLTARDEVALVEADVASGADHAGSDLRLAHLEAVAGAAFLGAGPELLGREAAKGELDRVLRALLHVRHTLHPELPLRGGKFVTGRSAPARPV